MCALGRRGGGGAKPQGTEQNKAPLESRQAEACVCIWKPQPSISSDFTSPRFPRVIQTAPRCVPSLEAPAARAFSPPEPGARP